MSSLQELDPSNDWKRWENLQEETTTKILSRDETVNHRDSRAWANTNATARQARAFLGEVQAVFLQSRKQRWRDNVMDSNFLEGQTETRLILQHELRGADGVTAAQDWHMMWQPGHANLGKAKPGIPCCTMAI